MNRYEMLVVGFLYILAIRKAWVDFHVQTIRFKATHFVWMKSGEIPKELAREIGQVWPWSYLYFEWWNWNFTRYIIHQDHYELMQEFMGEQLKRQDLNLETVQKELDEAAPKVVGSLLSAKTIQEEPIEEPKQE